MFRAKRKPTFFKERVSEEDSTPFVAIISRMDNNKRKFGYIDNTGNIVVPCMYTHAAVFSEGMAYVRRGDKFGYIDKTGKEVVKCIYDYACHFSEGLAAVGKNGRLGFIDKTGNVIILKEAN